jgi:L-alanine-DL-glutamate epimerase-like enolase superfamily enzyme
LVIGHDGISFGSRGEIVSTSIAAVRTHPISVPLARTFWMALEPYTAAAEVIVEIETTDGVIGVGEIHGRPQAEITQIVGSLFAPRLLGLDPMDHETIWEGLFSLTTSRATAQAAARDGQPHFGGGSRPQMMAALAGIDIALWDIKGKVLDLPLYRLLGGSSASVPCYASGGYYGPSGEASVDHLVDEMNRYVELGFKAIKMKVGGLPLEEDLIRVRKVREALPDVLLMLDANSAYDISSGIAAAKAFEPFAIHWLEEPVPWFDPVFGLSRVGAATSISIASGEQESHRFGCRDLVEQGRIRYLQFDCTRAGGITEWLRAAAHASAHHVQMAPHHDPQIHGHLVAAVPNGYMLEVFPDETRDPVWKSLFVNAPELVGSTLVLSDRPGLGFTIDWDFVRRYEVASR